MIGCKTGKIWGKTQELFNKNNVQIHRIEVLGNGFCSKHKHLNKWNAFFVETGEIDIIIYRTDAGKIIEDRTTLKAGEFTNVEPGLSHKFENKKNEPCVVYELYWTTLDGNDIVRETIGGINN